MSAKDDSPYQRGPYWLGRDQRRDGTLRTPFWTIFWYDQSARRLRSRSTGTAEVETAKDALDRLYLERERGQAFCPTCGRPFEGRGGYSVTAAIADYLLDREHVASAGALRARLSRVLDYLDATKQTKITCDAVNERWIARFRSWAATVPVIGPKGKDMGNPTPGTIEGSVRALQSAINFAFARHEIAFPAAFTPKKPKDVSVTPLFRADVALLAKMFAYAMEKPGRQSLLRFLQISVATWARPDAAHDFSTAPERRQWLDNAQVVSLNPSGRPQTRKYRASVPVGDRMAALIRDCKGFYVGVGSVRKAFEAMQDDLGLPRDRETGLKLIRRSISHIVRQRIGEEHWVQGKIMLGHHQASTSDLYALPDPANLGRALAATNAVIEEIETLAPGAFLRQNTGHAPDLKDVSREKMA